MNICTLKTLSGMNKFSLLWKDFPKPQYMYTVLKSHVAFTSTYFSLHVYN